MKKNYICILLTIAMLLFCRLTTYAQNTQSVKNSPNFSPWKKLGWDTGTYYILGDVNGDEHVDISDIVAIINLIAQNDKSNQRADVNEDGEIDISDIVKVINIMANVKPLSIDQNTLELSTGESKVVNILSGNGSYDVYNNNPTVVSVDQYVSGSGGGGRLPEYNRNPSRIVQYVSDSGGGERWGKQKINLRKKPTEGQTTVSTIDETHAHYTWIQGLIITALQPGMAVVRIKDRDNGQEQAINVTVKPRTCDYFYPEHSEIISGTSVAFRFTVTHPWTGEFSCRINLSEQSDMTEIVKTADIIVNGTKGEQTDYNQDGKIITFANLKPNTYYYWSISYFDKNENTSIQCYNDYFISGPDITELPNLCPDSNHPHIIDMGVAGKWACCNVGASAPWEHGGYYAWGETDEKDYFDWSNYIYCEGSFNTCHDLGTDIAGTEQDVAFMKWGADWRMPSINQLELLISNCSSEWITICGINGRKFTAPNGGTIFIPASGYRWKNDAVEVGENGIYWSSTEYPVIDSAKYLSIDSDDVCSWNYYRSYGRSVRPVYYEDPAVSAGLCPDSNHPHIIDMGEAGKWACCNVGASVPWEQGDYYAWGETETKDSYQWNNYIYCDGSEDSCHDIGNDIAGTDYDVAYMKWGGNWCLPNNDQFELLNNNCSVEKTNINGVVGRKYTCSNGGSIFLPAAGWFSNEENNYNGKEGYYWLSTLYPSRINSNKSFASAIIIELIQPGWGGIYRCLGCPVRPVQSDYTLGFCNVVSPTSGTTLEDTSVLFDFSINPLWNGSTIIRIMLSEDPEMKKTSNINYTLNGRVGTPCYHNADISGLNPNTKYYWRMAYYDWDNDTYVYCSPVSWFMTGNE